MAVEKIGPGVEITKDELDKHFRDMNYLIRREVLVGVPATDADRPPEKGQEITNAALLYIHEHGDPAHNLPARPTLGPGVQAVIPQTILSFERAAVAATNGDRGMIIQIMNAIGRRALSSVQGVFRAQQFAPLAPSTLRERYKKIGTIIEVSDQTGKRRKRQPEPSDVTILIDTGKLLRSINYVIRTRKGRIQ